ncbi:BCCT family transporter [Brachybacterium nesterenkovii]|uniref:BCCT family transporter n=1 Tax=Brachybacterium nesterenkovii TaxID=47847 RepID=UPI0032195D89
MASEPTSTSRPPAADLRDSAPDPADAAPQAGSAPASEAPLPGRPLPDSPVPDPRPEEPDYPHGLHPGLVPGVPVDRNRIRFGLDRVVFGITGTLVLAFVVWGILAPGAVGTVTGTAIGWVMRNLGWLFNLCVAGVLLFMLYLAFSRYGDIPLGPDGEKPEFSRFAWVAMMFGAGIGVGIFFYGPYEPLFHYVTPPPETVAGETPEALHHGLAQAIFEWGPHAWAIYALVGGAVAYSSYRRGRPSLLSSVFHALIGSRHTQGTVGRIIDMAAIIATVFGTAGALGIAALQIMEGVQVVTGVGPVGNGMLVLIIALLGVAVIVSAVSGVSRGIRYLSNVNIALTLALVAFVFVTGPTLFLLNLIPSSVMQYGQEVLGMMSRSLSWGEETVEWQAAWSVFYFAWWIAWSPFVGIFLARISRGRTIREFVLGTMLIPSSILVIAFAVFGGTAISMYRDGVEGITPEASPPQVLFGMFAHLPLSGLLSVLVCIVLAIFFITSADSASVVMGTLSSRGDPKPRKALVIFWGVMMIGIAVVMLLAGGETTLDALQSLMIIVTVPFAAILLLVAAAFHKELSTDPAAIRQDHASAALDLAVRRGIEEHGDDWTFPVGSSPAGQGAGAEIDSRSEHVTAWYRRTDEDGQPVDYDYETDTWGDGWTHEDDEPEGDEPADGERADGVTVDDERADSVPADGERAGGVATDAEPADGDPAARP